MLDNNDLKLIGKPILKISVRMFAKPQRILLSFLTLWGILKHPRVTNWVQPVQHTNVHNICTLEVKHGLWKISDSQLIEQLPKEMIFRSNIDAIHPSLAGQVKESVLAPVSQHPEEGFGESRVAYRCHWYFVFITKILKPKLEKIWI